MIVCVFFITIIVIPAIVELKSEPFYPIAGSSPEAGCLLAGDRVEIVCAHTLHPNGTVQFQKDKSPIELNDRYV